MRRYAVLLFVIVIVMAGCGSSRRQRSVTVPAYGVFSETTVTGSADGRVCEGDARAFTRGAEQFLAHYGAQAAYPADLYFVIMREPFSDFEARRCEPALLGKALARRLTTKQRSRLVGLLPGTMATAVRKALARAGS
jgi:uncharacterized protein YceK